MNKESLVWMAKGLGLKVSGTAPEIERLIAIANTIVDAAIVKLHDPDAAFVMNAIAPLRHQLAARAELKDLAPEDSDDFFAEEKIDGMRIWLITLNGRAFVYSRHYTKDIRLNAIRNIANVNLDQLMLSPAVDLCVYDAELYVNDSQVTRHDRLGLSIAAFASSGIVRRRARPVIFDVVVFNGSDVSQLPYAQRRELMISANLGPYLNKQHVGDIHAIFDAIVRDEGGEGLVLKQKDCPYMFGERKGWHKLKVGYADGANEYNAIITGMGDPGKNKNLGLVGSVTISDFDGNPLGEVGNFTDYVRRELTDETTGRLKTRLIGKQIEVRAMELTRDGKLRHAAFKRFLN